MKVVKAITEISREIDYAQLKLDKRADLSLSPGEQLRLLGRREGLEIALEIIKNNR